MEETLEANVARTLASAKARRADLLKDLTLVQQEIAKTDNLILALSGQKPSAIKFESHNPSKASVRESIAAQDGVVLHQTVKASRSSSNKRKGSKLLRKHVEEVLRDEPVSSIAEMLKRLEAVNPTSNGTLGRLLAKGRGKWVDKHGDEGWILLTDFTAT